MQQADELARLEALCHNVVGKVGDVLKNVLEGDEEQIANMKTVNDSMVTEIPLFCFFWLPLLIVPRLDWF